MMEVNSIRHGLNPVAKQFLEQIPKDGLSPGLQALFDSSNAVGFSLSVKLNQTPLTAFEERFPISAFD